MAAARKSSPGLYAPVKFQSPFLVSRPYGQERDETRPEILVAPWWPCEGKSIRGKDMVVACCQ